MILTRIKPFAPYVVILAGAIYFFYLANNFQFEPSQGRLGPDGWPKLILICLGVVCLYEIGRRALVLMGTIREPEVAPISEEEVADPEAVDESSHPLLVGAAVLATVLYLIAFETLGFFLSTFVFTSVLMWIGNFRRIGWNLLISFIFSFSFMFAFMRIIFVDLPLGVQPFTKVSTTLMTLMGIH